MARPSLRHPCGFTVVELLFVAAIVATIIGIAVPSMRDAADHLRTSMAAYYVAGQIRGARIDAVKRSAAVALRFQAGTPDYTFTLFADGNRNGIRTPDIAKGVDRPLGQPEQIGHNFPGVTFALHEGIADVDGAKSTGTDGVRIGSARILTLAPDGTATPGTLYLRGRRAQYAVRVFGATGRTRVLSYQRGTRTWITRRICRGW